MGHSLINSPIKQVDKSNKVIKTVNLSDMFAHPDLFDSTSY